MAIECIRNLRISHFTISSVTLAFICIILTFAFRESNFEIDGTKFQVVTIELSGLKMDSKSNDGDNRPAHKVNIDYSFDID